MGLIPVGAIFKGFTFDGEDSKDYGVYISGEAVFNAPERAVDMVEIPGRSGAYALDQGRFENIEVRYPAGIAADNETDFASGISALRNFLASRRGYCRLEDEYNPDEYRLAVYKSGLEVTPAQLKAGEFEIVFDCMPQRFLKSGETAQTVTSGGTLTNPTYFPAAPLLQVWGYGGFTINGQALEIISAPIGWKPVSYANMEAGGKITTYSGTLVIDFDDTIANPGDNFGWHLMPLDTIGTIFSDSETVDSVEVTAASNLSVNAVAIVSSQVRCRATSMPETFSTFVYGTSGVKTGYYEVLLRITGGGTKIFRSDISASYDGSHTVTVRQILNVPGNWSSSVMTGNFLQTNTFEINSSQSALGSPLYFDLDIGEAWKEEGGQVVSVNNAVTIPAMLPTLEPGANTITFDNTITQFKVVPRWWRV